MSTVDLLPLPCTITHVIVCETIGKQLPVVAARDRKECMKGKEPEPSMASRIPCDSLNACKTSGIKRGFSAIELL